MQSLDDKKKFVELMAMLCEVTDKEMSPLKTEIYYKALEEYNIDDLTSAISKLIKKRKFTSLPMPGEIIEIIEGSDKDFEEIALEQFIKAKESIVSIGSYRSVSFDDPIINKTLDAMGGWIQFCMTDNEQWTWKQKDFIKAYTMYKRQFDRNELDDIPEYLPGIHATSQSNMRQSYRPQIEYVVTNHPMKMPEAPKLKYYGRNAKKFLSDLSKSIKEKSKVTDDES